MLAQFEENVKWEGVEKSWADRREAWVNDCKAASSNPKVAALLLEFESNIKWASLEESWKTRKEAWEKELGSPNASQSITPKASSESSNSIIGNSNEPVTGKNVTNIILKNSSGDNFKLVKYRERDWKYSIAGFDIRGNHMLASDENSITLELQSPKELANFIFKIDFKTKKISDGKLVSAIDALEYLSANNNPVEYLEPEVVEIDDKVNGGDVKSIKLKSELLNSYFSLNKINTNEWVSEFEKIYSDDKSFFDIDRNKKDKFKQVAFDNNSITLEIIHESAITGQPSNQIKIDLKTKLTYARTYLDDEKKFSDWYKICLIMEGYDGPYEFVIIK